MDVAEVLVVREVQQVVRFASNRHFARFRDLHHYAVRRALNDSQVEGASNQVGLELVRTHLDHHILSYQRHTW